MDQNLSQEMAVTECGSIRKITGPVKASSQKACVKAGRMELATAGVNSHVPKSRHSINR